MPLTAHVVNGTYIVAADAPTTFTPEQLDKLAIGAIALGFPPFIGGILALLIENKTWSYARLSFLWLWSVTLVGFGIFASHGRFTHFIDFVAILHVQTEMLIIGLLLDASPSRSALFASAGGLLLSILMFALPGIRGTFFATSILGGWGDALIPVLLFHGKQYLLAIGGVGHFLNAFVTFFSFVQYTDVNLYLTAQLLAGAIHAIFTVAGLLHNRQLSGDIHLPIGTEREEGSVTKNPLASSPPRKKTVVVLVLVALVLSLLASIPINFMPRT